MNKSLQSGYFPPIFSRALVTPLIKKQLLNKETLKHYRPVSNLSFLSRILEKLLQKQLVNHISACDLQENLQSTYRPGNSTETALVSVMNDILLQIDRKRGVILVLLDLSSAFDTIDHAKLFDMF